MGSSGINAGLHGEDKRQDAFAQDFQDQEDLIQEDEAEQAYPTVDPPSHWQHHSVQRQASPLASHQARLVNAHFLGELTLLHTFPDVPMDEGTLGVHKIELVVNAGE